MTIFLHLDIETTGLDPKHDEILEIAWAFTGESFQLLSGTPHRSFLVESDDWVTTWAKLNANPIAKAMHQKSGLIDELREEDTLSIDMIGAELLADLKAIRTTLPEAGPVVLTGASVHFDRAFLSAYGILPSEEFLHYRQLDLSSVKIMLEAAGGHVEKREAKHRAYGDVLDQIAEARDLRNYVFVGVQDDR